MEKIILQHLSMYPLMQLEDFIKLLYQAEFGPSHLLNNVEYGRANLYQEYESLEKTDNLQIEDIGNGKIRVYLSGIKDIDAFFQLLLHSAINISGNSKDFIQSLDLLNKMIDEGKLPIDKKESKEFLDKYKKNPSPIHHSRIYHDTYTPAYRVLLKSDAEKINK